MQTANILGVKKKLSKDHRPAVVAQTKRVRQEPRANLPERKTESASCSEEEKNIVLVSPTSPRKNNIDYILQRLATKTGPVALLATGSAIPMAVTLLEIVKRRTPNLLHYSSIGRQSTLFTEASQSKLFPNFKSTLMALEAKCKAHRGRKEDGVGLLVWMRLPETELSSHDLRSHGSDSSSGSRNNQGTNEGSKVTSEVDRR